MNYIENPKTKGSGIICCIPQYGICPMKCSDCFFQSGRSYLEPLAENLPNMPSEKEAKGRVVRVNDGNDSNNHKKEVIEATKIYPMKFYNTSIPYGIEEFDAPVVLTINPGDRTDRDHVLLANIPNNLMFVRIRTNSWNVHNTVLHAANYYTARNIPVVLTFMAYHNELPSIISDDFKNDYIFRKRTLNSYYAITTDAWRRTMDLFKDEILVYSCGKIEGEKGKTGCKYCGNCLREYFATIERMK